jgi:hypothetical protein
MQEVADNGECTVVPSLTADDSRFCCCWLCCVIDITLFACTTMEYYCNTKCLRDCQFFLLVHFLQGVYSGPTAGVSHSTINHLSLQQHDFTMIDTDPLNLHVVRCADSCQRTSLQLGGPRYRFTVLGCRVNNLGLRHSVVHLQPLL